MSHPDVASVVTEAALPANLKPLWAKAQAAFEARNYGYAITLSQSIVQQEPKFLRGRRLARTAAARRKETEKKGFKISAGGLGNMQLKNQAKKDPLGTLAAIEKLLADDPFNIQVNELLYEVAVVCGMPETAAFALETIYEGHPENKKNAHRLGEHYLSHNDPGKAANLFNDMVRRDPTDLKAAQSALAATARQSMEANKWDEGTSIKDLVKNPNEAKDLEMKSRAGMTRDQIEEQIARWGEKYSENPNDLNVVKRIADLYEQLEDWSNALVYYDWGFQLSNGDSALETKVHRLKERIADVRIHELKDELANAPDAEKQAELEGLMHVRNETRIAEARRRVERNPTDANLRFELGSALCDDGQYSEAIPELQRAKNSPNIRTRVLLTLGKCFEAKGMNDLAVTQLESASEEVGSMNDLKKDLLYSLGLLYEKLGDQEKYLDALKQIYEADYGFKDVAERVEASYSG